MQTIKENPDPYKKDGMQMSLSKGVLEYLKNEANLTGHSFSHYTENLIRNGIAVYMMSDMTIKAHEAGDPEATEALAVFKEIFKYDFTDMESRESGTWGFIGWQEYTPKPESRLNDFKRIIVPSKKVSTTLYLTDPLIEALKSACEQFNLTMPQIIMYYIHTSIITSKIRQNALVKTKAQEGTIEATEYVSVSIPRDENGTRQCVLIMPKERKKLEVIPGGLIFE